MTSPIPANPWSDKDVEAHWDKVAHRYVLENERVKEAHNQRFAEAVRWLQLEDNLKVLNITSRDGEATDHILKRNSSCEVVNAEISANLIHVAAKIRPGIHQVKIDSYSSIPFPESAFQRILSLETLEHVAEPLAFLRELHRVSTPNAQMVLSCPPATSEFPYRVYTLFFGGHGEGPHRFPPSGRVKKMCDLTGWKVILHKGTVLIPAGPLFLQRLGERVIERFQNTFISEFGIRQFYVCQKK